ncbi:unnamed protein product [Prunus brigantina]
MEILEPVASQSRLFLGMEEKSMLDMMLGNFQATGKRQSYQEINGNKQIHVVHLHFQVSACYKAPQIFPEVSRSFGPHHMHDSRRNHAPLQAYFNTYVRLQT